METESRTLCFCHAPDILKFPIYFGKVTFFLPVLEGREGVGEERETERGEREREGEGKKKGERKKGRKRGREGGRKGGREGKYLFKTAMGLWVYSLFSRVHIHSLTFLYSSLPGPCEFSDSYGNYEDEQISAYPGPEISNKLCNFLKSRGPAFFLIVSPIEFSTEPFTSIQ